MKIKWSEHLSIGNAMIDSDHKNLIVVVNRVNDAIQTGDRVALSKSFELLEAYMRIHSQNEEKFAEAISYPFVQDKMAQQQLMDELRYMIKKLTVIDEDWPGNILEMYSRFLAGWIIDHIIKTNMPMKQMLLAYPYDFIPGKNKDSFSFQTTMVIPIVSYIDSKPSAY